MKRQFSIRLLVLVTAAASLPFAWIAHVRSLQHAEDRAMEAVAIVTDRRNVWFEENPWWFSLCGFAQHATRVNLSGSEIADDQLFVVNSFHRPDALDLTTTSISGRGLRSLRPMPTVTWLSLWDSRRIDAEALQYLDRFPNLTFLHLAETGVSDEGLAHVGRLPNLQLLALAVTPIRGHGLSHLADLAHLRELDLQSSHVDDEGLRSIGTFPALRILWLNDTRITDKTVAALSNLTQLEELSLTRTSVSDDCIPSLKRMRSLRRIMLEETAVTSEGIRDLETHLPGVEVSDGTLARQYERLDR